MTFQKIIESVPNYQSFLTVDELDDSTWNLAAEYPDAVTVFEAGKSRQGHPIYCLKIGDGPQNALCYACTHANEPVGAMTIEFFSRALAEDESFRNQLGFTWYLIKCIDPDGMRLNESWFKKPFTIFNYSKNFFRSVANEQVEWTFPIDYKTLFFRETLPETEILMRLIDELQPMFMYSLHNAMFSGAHWFLSHELPELYDVLRETALKEDVALHIGELEAPYITELSPAIFKTFGISDLYDYTEKTTGRRPAFYCGTSSSEYASLKGECLTLVSELPYLYDARVQDLTESPISRKEAILHNIEMTQAHFSVLDNLFYDLRPYISSDNPFVKLVEESLATYTETNRAKKRLARKNPELKQKAKICQMFDSHYTSKFYNGLIVGLAARACAFELERIKEDEPENEYAYSVIEETLELAEKLLKVFCDQLEAELKYEVMSIQKLIRIQLESGLIVAKHVGEARSLKEVRLS